MVKLVSPVSVNDMKREKSQCLQGFMLNWSEHWTVAPGAGGSSPLVHPKMLCNPVIARLFSHSHFYALSPKIPPKSTESSVHERGIGNGESVEIY